ncbi:FtsK/SpoIIIE domain-containing protein, partial [Romboutsia sp.]|uniref:FtsK/SpoIIIE domain-containing protein n=1 Tax=Romboutsia sp. TaxID=1965302 RepID=UPI002CF88E4E
WFISAWVDLEEDKKVIKKKYDKEKENKELEEMKKEIKEYKNKLASLEMPKMLPYKYIWTNSKGTLRVCIGHDLYNNPVWIDFYKNNHLLIAGATGYGKTSIIRTILISLMLSYDKDSLKIILVDFKNTDLPPFEIYQQVNRECIFEEDRFNKMLDSLSKEGKERANKIRGKGHFNIIDYNEAEADRIKPVIVVIDEVSQICDNTKLRDKLIKCMGLVRAYGIYFIVATQIPSKDTVGKIKSHTIHRIGLATADKVDSDMIIKNANLQDIKDKGRCKYDVDGKLILTQSFYTEMEDVKGYLKHLKK